MQTTTAQYKEPVHAEHHQVLACRAAMARQFMRMFHITDEVIAAKVAVDEAVGNYREAILKAVREQSDKM